LTFSDRKHLLSVDVKLNQGSSRGGSDGGKDKGKGGNSNLVCVIQLMRQQKNDRPRVGSKRPARGFLIAAERRCGIDAASKTALKNSPGEDPRVKQMITSFEYFLDMPARAGIRFGRQLRWQKVRRRRSLRADQTEVVSLGLPAGVGNINRPCKPISINSVGHDQSRKRRLFCARRSDTPTLNHTDSSRLSITRDLT